MMDRRFAPIPLAPLAPDLFVGPAPLAPEDIETLRGLGITRLLSLQTDRDLGSFGLRWSSLWQLHLAKGIQATRIPIVDFDKNDFARRLGEAVAALDELIADPASPNRVYVHCTAGINRSTTVTLAWLARNFTLEQADDTLMAAHPGAIPYRDLVTRWLKKPGR